MEYDEQPNYDMIRFFMIQTLLQANVRPDTNFSWTKRTEDDTAEIEESADCEDYEDRKSVV